MNNIFIKNVSPVQKNFLGNGAIYHGYAGMPDDANRVYSEELCDEEARRIENMRLKIARTFYGWWAWDEKTDTWDWDNDIMTAFYGWLDRMKKAGVSVALNTGWCMPDDITSTGWNGKSPFTVEGDWDASCKKYGDWVSETYYQLVEKRGFTNVKYFVMFTEPQNGNPRNAHETKSIYECWHDATRAAHNALVRDGRRQKITIMGPNEGSTVDSVMTGWVAKNAADIIDVYSSHNYQWLRAVDDKYIKSGKTSMQVLGFYARAAQEVKLKPHTEYIAEIEALYESDFIQDGCYIFGVFEHHPEIDVIAGGGLRESINGSKLCLYPAEMTKEYKKYSVRFNSGDSDKALLGIFSGIKEPEELNGKTYTLLEEYANKKTATLYVNSMSLYEAETGENVATDSDFSENYKHWNHSTSAGGIKEPYYDWCEWVDTALSLIPGESDDKSYCYDEYNICCNRDNSRKEYGSEVVDSAVALMNSGVRATLLWTLFDQQWPNNHTYNNDSFVDGDHRCGCMPILTRSLVPHLGFYAITLLSRYTAEGSQIFKGEGNNNLHTTMTVSPEGEITVIVVNRKAEADEFSLQFENPISKTLSRHLFDPETLIPDEKAEIIGIDKTFEDVGNTLCDTLPPYSVAVYTTMAD